MSPNINATVANTLARMARPRSSLVEFLSNFKLALLSFFLLLLRVVLAARGLQK